MNAMISAHTVAAIRFGYGLPLPKAAPDQPDAMLRLLAAPDAMAKRWPIPGMTALLPQIQALGVLRKSAKKNAKDQPEYRQMSQQFAALTFGSMKATFARALDASDGFRERLVAFWSDHFTVVAKDKFQSMLPFALVEDAIRPNLNGPFSTLLTAVTLHPAMLSYLDQPQSVGPDSPVGLKKGRGLNENLARELMELHSLGVGANYGQQDVQEMARLLTGLTYENGGVMRFEERMAEPGPETVLGKTYDGKGIDPILEMLADLGRRPETAAHIARKLAVHFVSDTPDPDLVAAIEAAFTASGGDLMQCYSAMLNHPAAWSTPLEKARQPFDFLVAAFRALGMQEKAFMALEDRQIRRLVVQPLSNMGQPFKTPGGPDGWSEAAEDWITPQGLATRITWSMQVPERVLKRLPDPVDFATACLADHASAALLQAAARAEDRQQGVGLVLASADFNRR